MPAPAAQARPPRPAGPLQPPTRLPLTPAPGESIEDVAQAFARVHELRVAQLSLSDYWECRVCRTAGFGAGLVAALDHLRKAGAAAPVQAAP